MECSASDSLEDRPDLRGFRSIGFQLQKLLEMDDCLVIALQAVLHKSELVVGVRIFGI